MVHSMESIDKSSVRILLTPPSFEEGLGRVIYVKSAGTALPLRVTSAQRVSPSRSRLR